MKRIVTFVVLATIALAVLFPGAAAAQETDGVTVSLQPDTNTVSPGEQTELDIVVEKADNGVTTFNITTEIINTEVARVIDVEDKTGASSAFTKTKIKNGTAVLDVGVAGGDYSTENPVVGTVTVEGVAAGDTEAEISNQASQVGDADASAYEITSNKSELTVSGMDPINVTVDPIVSEITVDGQTKVNINVEDATDGLSTYDITLQNSNEDTAVFTDAVDKTGASSTITDVTVESASANIDTGLTGSVANLDKVTVATVTVSGVSVGSTDISINESNLLVGSGSKEYVTNKLTDTSINVTSTDQLPSVDDEGTPAADTDGDGRLDDVDGSGEADNLDVIQLFQNTESDVIRENKEKFDFNGDGDVNNLDVVALFQRVD